MNTRHHTAFALALLGVALTANELLAQSTYIPYAFTNFVGLPGVPGNADGSGSAAEFYSPFGVAVDSSGNVYVTDSGNNTIRKVTPDGVVTTLAGCPACGNAYADGTNSAARFSFPHGVAVDGMGNVYVADQNNWTVRKLTPVGTNWVVTTLPGTYGATVGVAVDRAGNVYVASLDNAIRKVTPVGTNWVVATLAGLAPYPGSVDGTNGGARFYSPRGVAVDGAGNVYVADGGNATIRKITPDGVVTTIAGKVGNVGSADGTNSAARFIDLSSIAVDSAGNLYGVAAK